MTSRYRIPGDGARALDLLVKLGRAEEAVRGRLRTGLRESGLTENQFGVLELLHHLGSLYQHEIGSKLAMSRANVTLLVDRLGDMGLVHRHRDERDRRRIAVSLTTEGESRVDEAFRRHVDRVVQLFSVLTPGEQRELAVLCRKLDFSREKSAVVD